MMESDEAAVFPVVLYDGERETDVGNVKIHNMLGFKQFQTMLSQIIGISYNNLTTYLVDSKKSKISTERRKILITGKANFSALVRERNCYFLVVLKRSRRDRRKKPGKQSGLELSPGPSVSLEDLIRLRLNQLCDGQTSSCDSCYYEDQVHDLHMERENCVNMIFTSNYAFDSAFNVRFPKVEDAYSRVQSRKSQPLCKECVKAGKQGRPAPFHLCVNDDVIKGGFRSPVGPISRPR